MVVQSISPSLVLAVSKSVLSQPPAASRADVTPPRIALPTLAQSISPSRVLASSKSVESVVPREASASCTAVRILEPIEAQSTALTPSTMPPKMAGSCATSVGTALSSPSASSLMTVMAAGTSSGRAAEMPLTRPLSSCVPALIRRDALRARKPVSEVMIPVAACMMGATLSVRLPRRPSTMDMAAGRITSVSVGSSSSSRSPSTPTASSM